MSGTRNENMGFIVLLRKEVCARETDLGLRALE